MQNGTYIVATLIDFESMPQKNNPNYVNNDLVLSQQYEDRYGNTQNNYIKVTIQQNDVQRVGELSRKLKGKRVIVPAMYSLKSGISKNTGKPYAFNSVLMPKDSEITEVQ